MANVNVKEEVTDIILMRLMREAAEAGLLTQKELDAICDRAAKLYISKDVLV